MDNATSQTWDEIQKWAEARGGGLDRHGDKVFYSIQNGIIRLWPEMLGGRLGVGFSIRQERPVGPHPNLAEMQVVAAATGVTVGDSAIKFMDRRIRRLWGSSIADVEFALTAIMAQPSWSEPGTGVTVRS